MAWIGNFAGELFTKQGHLGSALVGSFPNDEKNSIMHKPVMRVEAACASGGIAFASAVNAVRYGAADIALAVGAEVQTTVSARQGAEYLARASHFSRERQIDDFTFPAIFARRTKIALENGVIVPDDLAKISFKAYSNANKNPNAHMRYVKPDLDSFRTASNKNPNFLSNPDLKPYLKVSDCSQVSDGAAGCIVANEEGLKKLGLSITNNASDLVEIKGLGHSTGNLYVDSDPLFMHSTNAAAKSAYTQAKNIKPKDIGVGEVHDCFSLTEILMYEALGFAEKGKGAGLIRNGDTELDGKIPINTGGGLIGFGHPTGATGIKQVVEVANQILGKCDSGYQLKKTPSLGICANMGGDDKTAVVTILGRV